MPRKRELSTSSFIDQGHGSFRFVRASRDPEFKDTRDALRYNTVPSRTVAHSETRAENPLAALMQCAPGQEPLTSLSELSPLRDIIQDAIDGLTERDRWVVDAIISARMSLRDLADQLGLSKTHVARIRDEALAKLRLALQDNPTIKEHLT